MANILVHIFKGHKHSIQYCCKCQNARCEDCGKIREHITFSVCSDCYGKRLKSMTPEEFELHSNAIADGCNP